MEFDQVSEIQKALYQQLSAAPVRMTFSKVHDENALSLTQASN